MIVTMRGPGQTIIQIGEYTAELLRSKTAGDATWYVVVQPRYSREIIAIDRYLSFEDARSAAFHALEELDRREAKGQTA